MTIRAGIYCRMSLATMGDTTKVDAQERICRELCRQLGWEVAEGVGHPHLNGAYVDNSLSAWHRKVRRPGWEAMLTDVQAGRITAIVTYHGDRLVRQPRDLEKLIDIAEARGTLLASPSGTKDLSRRDDRAMARVIAAFAENEAAAASERRKGQYERWRLQGKVRPGGRGGRAFGFDTKGSVLPQDRCVLATRELTGEPDVIREMAARVLAGEPVGLIARDLSARGWRTPAGRPFSHGTIRKMLARPRYAGLMPDGEHQAAWAPILDRQTWEDVCVILDAKAAGFAYATNARKYLLSGIAVCGAPACGSPLQIRYEARRPTQSGYGCVRPGCRKVQRNAVLLDEYVITRVLAKLNDPGNPAAKQPELPQLAGHFRALDIQQAEAEAKLADPDYPHTALMERRLDAIKERRAQLRELAAGDARSRLLSSHTGLTRAEWDALPLATRRALVAACFTVTVLPASKRGPGFNSGDVRLDPA